MPDPGRQYLAVVKQLTYRHPAEHHTEKDIFYTGKGWLMSPTKRALGHLIPRPRMWTAMWYSIWRPSPTRLIGGITRSSRSAPVQHTLPAVIGRGLPPYTPTYGQSGRVSLYRSAVKPVQNRRPWVYQNRDPIPENVYQNRDTVPEKGCSRDLVPSGAGGTFPTSGPADRRTSRGGYESATARSSGRTSFSTISRVRSGLVEAIWMAT